MPKYMIYILISCGALILLILFFVIRKKLKRKKKTEADRIKKKIASLNKNKHKKESSKEPAPKNPNEELLQFEEFTPPAEEKSNATPIFSDYLEENKSDNNDTIGQSKEMPISYEELLRRRAARQAEKNTQNLQEAQNPATFDEFDDFNDFQAKHSSYTRYQSDPILIQQIKDLPPEMKAVVFGNLFSKINHDKL